MAVSRCLIPLDGTNDTLSFSQKRDFILFEGVPFVGSNAGTLWENVMCEGIDCDFCEPVYNTDDLYFQYKLTEDSCIWVLLTDKDGNVISNLSMIAGKDFKVIDNVNYKTYLISLSGIENLPNCFRIVICSAKTSNCSIITSCSDPNDSHFVIDFAGCCITNGLEYDVVYSEKYCLISDCENKPLLEIEGVNSKFDCEGKYYGPNQTTSIKFKNKFKMFGSLENTEDTFEFTQQNNHTKSRVSVTDSLLLRSYGKIPPYFKDKLKQAFSSEKTYINGIEVTAEKISKNMDIGSMWFINETIKRVDCNNDFTCS